MEKAKSLELKGIKKFGFHWVQGPDLNWRPSGYEPDELPGCSTLHLLRLEESIIISACKA